MSIFLTHAQTQYLNYEIDPVTGHPLKFSKSRNQGVFGDHARDTGIPSEVGLTAALAHAQALACTQAYQHGSMCMCTCAHPNIQAGVCVVCRCGFNVWCVSVCVFRCGATTC